MTLARRASRLAAALVLAGAVAIGAAAEPAQGASAPTHVAIVVDFGGGDVRGACVPSGGSGSAVLGAHFQVTYNNAGLVAIIDGVGSMTPTTTLYWSYWHSAGSSWSYATTGPATFHPPAGTVEGWAYNDGKAGPATTPSYASICAGQDSPPTPAPSTRHTTSAAASQPGSAPPPPPPPGASTPAPGNASTTAAAAGSHPASPAARRHGGAKATPKASSGRVGLPAQASSASSSADRAPAVRLVGATATAPHPSAAPAWGTALALLAAVSIGGAAFWRLRRQRQGAG